MVTTSRPTVPLARWRWRAPGHTSCEATRTSQRRLDPWPHCRHPAGGCRKPGTLPRFLPPKRMLVLVDNPFQYWKCQLDCWKNKFEVTYTLLIRQLHPIHPPTVHLYFVPRVYFSHPPNIEFTPEILFFGVLDIYFRVYNIKGIRWVITASLIWMLKINRSHIPILLGNTHSGGLYT
jgi:hypothetical protein